MGYCVSMTITLEDSWINKDVVETWDDLIQPDVNIVVPVGPRLLVVEAEGVEELVFDHSLVVAARPQRQDLSGLLVSNPGEAPGRYQMPSRC